MTAVSAHKAQSTGAGGIEPPDAESGRFARKLVFFFLVVTAVLICAGLMVLEHWQANARKAAHHELSAIADLKMAQIAHWREERLADARFFSRARFVAQDIQHFLENRDSLTNRAAVLHWLNLLKSGERYEAAMILDANLEPVVKIPDTASEPTTLRHNLMEQAIKTRDVVMSDLHRDASGNVVHIDVFLPIYEGAEFRNSRPIAAVLLKLDPRRFLFPIVHSWPTPSRSAESMLVRRDGQDILFLNDLRYHPGSSLNLRLPITNIHLPSAQALLGDTNVIEGIDYRGMPVVAAGRIISNTPWAMVSKMDQSEIYAPLRRQWMIVMSALGTLLVIAALVTVLVWRQRTQRFLIRELDLEKDRSAFAERLAHIMRSANDIILMLDSKGRVVDVNDYALNSYGYTLAEMKERHVRDLRAPEARPATDSDLNRVKVDEALLLETIHQRKDGTTFPVEVSCRRIKVGDQSYFLSIVRDITQRKAHEHEIERLNRLYAALSQVNQAVVRAVAREDLEREVCRVLVEYGGFQMAWIGWIDGTGSQVIPIAHFGDGLGFLTQARLLGDFHNPHMRSPIATAIRENRSCICNDLQDGSVSQPWRAAAAQAGWHSLAAFPIRQEGVIRGALTVYSHQPEFFGAKEQSLLEEAAADISYGLDSILNDQQRRRAEEALKDTKEQLVRVNADLERTVVERTAQLVEANANLQNFAYTAAHDLRAPLRAIRGFATIALEECSAGIDETGQSHLQRVMQSADQMDRLLTDLLDYCKITQAEIELKPVDLQRAVEEAIALLDADILTKHAHIEIEGPLPSAIGHPATVVLIVSNFIANALKFTKPNIQPDIRIQAEVVDSSIRLSVQDNGIGIDREDIGRLFGVFQRLHSKQAYPGTGLGLALARKGAERMGGTVGVDSTPGQGSRFWVQLKATQPDIHTDAANSRVQRDTVPQPAL